jgi:thiol-disulfide isomerase/thioredoxin
VRRSLGLLAAAALLIAAAWAGHRLHRATVTAGAIRVPAGEASAPLPPVAAQGTPLEPGVPLEPGMAPTRSIPDRLPAFTLHDVEGHATPVSTWQDRSLILNFWATWCAPCRREMPLLQSLDRDGGGRGFRVVGIAVDHADAVRAFAQSLHIGYPLLVGDEDALDVAGRLGVTTPAFPFTVFTDRRGQIVALFVGELHKAQADLILAAVIAVNQDRVDVGAARQRIATGLADLPGGSASP